MEKKVKGGLGIERAYKSRSGVLYLIRGHIAALNGCITKYAASLSQSEIDSLNTAIQHLNGVIAHSSEVYESTMKPKFIQQANETRQEEASRAGSTGPQESDAPDVQPSDGPA